ncbi:MAG: hypothetical protein JWM27_2540 [Gemmatimonadetes bacterium]|nr:hypothetical protein [Gemmatimonadota bacterium]
MTRRLALAALAGSALLIAASYATAVLPGGAPPAAGWGMALGIPATLVSLMILGAARPGQGIGRLAWPFAFVGGALVLGFGLALALPADEAAGVPLYLGLPLRAAVILYGIGLMPIAVLPVAYALTFSTQTLSQADIDRVRLAGEAWARGRASVASADSAGGGAHGSVSVDSTTASQDDELAAAAGTVGR